MRTTFLKLANLAILIPAASLFVYGQTAAPSRGAVKIPTQVVEIQDHRLTINLQGLRDGVDWVLGVVPAPKQVSNALVAAVRGDSLRADKPPAIRVPAEQWISSTPGEAQVRLPESEMGREGPLFVRVNAPPGTEFLVQARGKLAAALTLASSEIVLHNGRLADGRATTFSRMARAAASPLDRGPQLLPDGTTRVEMDQLKRHIKSVSRPAASAIPANCCQGKADQAVVLRLSIGADGRVTHTRRLFGDRSLAEACAAAAMQWEFIPIHVDGTYSAVAADVMFLASPSGFKVSLLD